MRIVIDLPDELVEKIEPSIRAFFGEMTKDWSFERIIVHRFMTELRWRWSSYVWHCIANDHTLLESREAEALKGRIEVLEEEYNEKYSRDNASTRAEQAKDKIEAEFDRLTGFEA